MDAYDSPWKDALSHFFPDFMAFYFPQAYAAIDWSRPYELSPALGQYGGAGGSQLALAASCVCVSAPGLCAAAGFSRFEVERRYAAKRQLMQLLYQRGWNERSIMELYRVIDWMMHLPEELTRQLRREVATWEQEDRSVGWT